VSRLLPWLRPYRVTLGLGLLTTAVASALDAVSLLLLIPLFRHLFGTTAGLTAGMNGLEGTVDRALAPLLDGASPVGVTLRLVLVLWAALLGKNLLNYLAGQLSVRAQEGLVRDLRTALFEHLLRLDLGWLERVKSGQVIARVMHDADQVKAAVSAGLASFVQNLLLIGTTLLVLGQLSLRLTLLTLAAAPLLLAGIRGLLKRLRRQARARADEAGAMTATVAERLQAVKLIRLHGAEPHETGRFREQANQYRRAVARTQRFAQLTSPVSELFGGLLMVLLVVVGTTPALLGQALSPEGLVVFLVAALRMMAPLKALTQFPNQMAQALASAERVFEVLDRPVDEPAEPTGAPASFQRGVAFEEVSFAYGPGQPLVLDGVSFSLPRGSTVALVGPSGAGKTTIAELLPRLREPVSGRILVDGVPLPGLERRSLRALMAMVGQETVVFNDTVRANIAYGRSGASDAEIARAAQAANADEFIGRLPQGYLTVLGERGTRLSGGQRQRIAIARALLRDAPILILDEATSALDSESERLVQDALLRLMRDRTTLVIAHRLTTVRHATQILVLDEGRIVQRGTHEELLRSEGLYRRLSASQFGLAPVPD
jgi:subfamily B ATP-binding cassette protein MsbA